jgi:hypothetical protein
LAIAILPGGVMVAQNPLLPQDGMEIEELCK